jgi:hypothetical protein
MSDAMNKKKWLLFAKQAKGADIQEIHVAREDRGTSVILKYNAKAPRYGRVVTGEWHIETKDQDAKDKDPAKVDEEVRAFLDKARRDFFVKREGGLAGDAFKGKQDDEASKAKPLAPSEKPASK